MPAFVGPIEFEVISASGILSVGDTFALSPKSTQKVSGGSGAFNTGDFLNQKSVFSITNFYDIDLIDQPQTFNK
ncbi:spore germination protein [Metabacillus herbersteinensis]|uniref:Spore germination protein n=1 Tax=Metabacillus herbersteinensis TaxID=283816 RepID=A0ABV6GCP1_9BACI